ncbi:hypothetical protein BKP42_61440 [Rhodococcus erythropolis]|nr:hypothetical protein BKP42_61440 [Rhodococcus erythropolis]
MAYKSASTRPQERWPLLTAPSAGPLNRYFSASPDKENLVGERRRFAGETDPRLLATWHPQKSARGPRSTMSVPNDPIYGGTIRCAARTASPHRRGTSD